ncbi:MAG TPA: helix-turn-helix domain-containing protein [Vicinamibacterales bacterium]
MTTVKETQTSLEKALDVCEALAGAQRGLTVTELARALKQPAPTVHRLLGVLKRRGFVRQDEDTSRYSLTLKMLDMSFRLLGRSELRLHAYPVLREYVLRTGLRAFIAVPAGGEVTYLWSAGPDEVGMHTTYGREMPVHCAMYVERTANRRLSCVKLEQPRDATQWDRVAVRFGAPAAASPLQRLLCTCAPVHDYTGRQVARVGVFTHAADEQPFCADQTAAAMELARLISLRLGHLPAASVALGA